MPKKSKHAAPIPKRQRSRRANPLAAAEGEGARAKSASSKIIYPPHTPEQINPDPLDGIALRDEDLTVYHINNDGGASVPASHDSGTLTLSPGGEGRGEGGRKSTIHPQPIFSSNGIWLYHDNCLAVMDAIIDKYPEGRFDCIFADPPYFLSNGGISCHAGKMVKVDKGDWDKSQGPEINHEFNRSWLERCQKVLKPNGTIWVSGTHHVIFSIGYAMQQLGFKILNDIAWEKPNPPPNLSCRYFTHSTETILWAAKGEKSKHVFNYQDMRKVTGKQMKTVWRTREFNFAGENQFDEEKPKSENQPAVGGSIWTMTAPGSDEKKEGKQPRAE